MNRWIPAGATQGWRPYAWMAAVLVVFLLPVLANPGFYSYDEWQKADHVIRHGLAHYMRQYVSMGPGAEFGVPVRPLSFAVQGIVALWMTTLPFLVHAVDVAMHGAVAVLLYLAVKRHAGDARVALAAALIFICSPLAMPSVVWSAALMDRLLALWGLAAWLLAQPYLDRRGGLAWLAASSGAVALAMLSKETALVLPAALACVALLKPGMLRERRLWALAAAWSVPVAAYMAWRIPAIAGTLARPPGSGYGISASHLPEGLMLYLTFPFMPELYEAVNWVFASPLSVGIAAALHAALLVALWKRHGVRAALAYALFYLLFLVPVLPIPTRGARYLYASGLATAVALAVLLPRGPGWRGTLVPVLAAILIVVGTVHAFVIQSFAYALGTCMNRAGISAESAWLSAGRPPAVRFTALPGAGQHVLDRLFTGREQLGTHAPILFLDARSPQAPPPGTVDLSFNADCVVFRPVPNAQAK